MRQLDRETITIPPDGRPENVQPRWRKDFPIDWPQDNYVARRDFTKFMVLTSLAFAVGQLWIAAQNFFRKRRGELPMNRIATVDQIPVGGLLNFSYPTANDKCVLVRSDAQTFVAYDQRCSHLSCAVVPKPSENRIDCPCHEGVFELSTGLPIAGPPRRPLSRIKLEVRQGAIYATEIEKRAI
ncbi:MAG TPA: Rieske (2Fe-2S) protein [Blastocatellia bacterium]|nr:Rieske (2Fe-2S) protein [Blastocatellia bacterium]